MPTTIRLIVTLLALGVTANYDCVAEGSDQELPAAHWKGETLEVVGLSGRHPVTIGYPAKKAGPLTAQSAEKLPAGVYRLWLVVRPSHVAGAIAFNGGLHVNVDGQPAADFPGIHFAQVNQPEERVGTVIHTGNGVISVALQAHTDAKASQKAFETAAVKAGPPKLDEALNANAIPDSEAELETVANPARMFYYVLDKASLTPVSLSGHVSAVGVDKIRYAPGEMLNGTATVWDVGGKGGKGTLTFYLEHELQTRDKVKELPVELSATPQSIPFSIKLPERELGYALVAVYTSADGRDKSEAAEYFTITDNCFRTAIFGNHYGGQGFTKLSPDQMQAAARGARASYANACEVFAWAEEDMVEMSPATDWWFSGQTCYQLSKQGLQNTIRIAHENGIAMVTYGKFIMSGYLGWRTAYDYPNDHRGQYVYPVGMWEGCNGVIMDRFFNKEFVPYGFRPEVRGEQAFNAWWQAFLPINPDPTPRMTRLAAEEAARSVEMFGWDAIRWDGQPRGGGGCGGTGEYDYLAARRTQTLVRYFKDIVAAKYPKFRHGYNYLLVQDKPDYGWAVEDYELDELCRGGGLLMNESIGNTTAGKPFGWMARNLQVEGDLARERGGYLLGISYATDPRDRLVETSLYFASGCRPMGGTASDPILNRYATRYARYVFDETLRRLDKPEGILKPSAETKLWWQGFVYETRPENGASQLVVNLLNIPRDGVTRGNDVNLPVHWDMPLATEPVTFQLTLPAGCQAVAANLIDPFTLTVTPAAIKDGQVSVPAVVAWKVLVLDLKTDAGAPTLAARFGPPKTFGVPRPDLKVARAEPVTLDIHQPVADVTRVFASLTPTPPAGANLDESNWEQRNQALLTKATAHKPEDYLKGWWKGGTLGDDLKLKDKAWDFGELTPRRNGVMDIFYARGALDYRLRMSEVFAGLTRFQVRDAPLMGLFRAGGGHYLANGIGWAEFSQYDVLLHTGIPHCAIGVENSYALPAYVKAGGAVLFTGGEYAFGKGGYDFTVLERELLPVLCVENVDASYSTEPLVLEPGKDFAELGAKLDFTANPSFWAYNHIALKPDPRVKVFLKSGNRPILVGWQVEKGRVACLLTDHRGKSGDGVTAFFDWDQWPDLMRATLVWLAPDAYRQDPPAAKPINAADLQRLRGELEGAAVDDLMADDTHAGSLKEADLKQRVKQLKAALQGSGPELAGLFVEQLAAVANLPVDIRDRLIDFIARQPPPDLAVAAKRCVKSREPAIRQNGYQLLAIAGDAEFPRVLQSPPDTMETDPLARERYLALALARYGKPDLSAVAKTNVDAWNRQELATKNAYTGGKDWSLAAPEQPCLDAQVLFRRVAWLAYLARLEPETYGAKFAREWLLTAKYQDYCDSSAAGLWGTNMSPTQRRVAEAKTREWNEVRAQFGRLQQVTRPAVEALLTKNPAQAAAGFAGANFMPEGRLCINLLGSRPVAETQPVLTTLTKAKLPLLSEFAKARLKAGP